MGEQQDYHWLDKHARVRINTVRLSTTPRHGSELWAHMRNFHFVAHDGNMDKKPPPPDDDAPPSDDEGRARRCYFIFASERQRLLRLGAERWIDSRRASIPRGGVPRILPQEAAVLSDPKEWPFTRPAQWDPDSSFYPMELLQVNFANAPIRMSCKRSLSRFGVSVSGLRTT